MDRESAGSLPDSAEADPPADAGEAARDQDQLGADGGAARPAGVCAVAADCGQATLASNALEGRWFSGPLMTSTRSRRARTPRPVLSHRMPAAGPSPATNAPGGRRHAARQG